MKAGRLTALTLVASVALGACDVAPAGTPPAADADTSNPIARPSLPVPTSSETPPLAQPSPSGDAAGAPTFAPIRGTAFGSDSLVETAATSDGGLYVAASLRSEEDIGAVTITALDGTGAVRPGWPVGLGVEVDSCEIAVADDDSLRLACDATAYAFEVDGRPLPGWPVDLGGGAESAIVVGRELRAQIADRIWVAVSPDGSTAIQRGRIEPASYVASTEPTTDAEGEPIEGMPWSVTLSDSTGLLPGWPVEVPFSASEPVVGRDGTVYLVALGKEEGTSQLIVISRTGKRLASRAALINDVPPHDGSWYGPYIPQSPVVGPDGSVWVVGQSRAYAFDPQGRLRAGWPAKLGAPLADTGYCSEECDIDCYYLPADPFIDRAGTLYVLRATSSKSTGGSILAIGLDGNVVPGWPVQLKRAGSEFWYGTVGPDGTVFVDAYEPEPEVNRTDSCAEPASLTALAIRPDSTVRYRVTLIDP